MILADATADPARLGRMPLTLEVEVERAGPVAASATEEGRALPAVRGDHPCRGKARPPGASAPALCRADPCRRSADRDRRDAQGKEGWLRPTACELVARRSSNTRWRTWERRQARPMSALVMASDRPRGEARRAKVALPASVPDWADGAAPPESRPPRPLAPSAISSTRKARRRPACDTGRGTAGTWIHQLLERLPAVEPSAGQLPHRSLAGKVGGLKDEGLRQEIVAQVCAILSDPEFRAFFGAGSLGEAPLAATLSDGRVIAGTVDRLLVEGERGFGH